MFRPKCLTSALSPSAAFKLNAQAQQEISLHVFEFTRLSWFKGRFRSKGHDMGIFGNSLNAQW